MCHVCEFHALNVTIFVFLCLALERRDDNRIHKCCWVMAKTINVTKLDGGTVESYD